jgi:hypothetical protein
MSKRRDQFCDGLVFDRRAKLRGLVFSVPTTSQSLPFLAIAMASECATPFAFMETVASENVATRTFST